MVDDKLIGEAIQIIKESFANFFQLTTPEDIDNFFIYGGCFYFAVALKWIFPEAILYRNIGHIVTRIGNKYYDYQGCGNLGKSGIQNKMKINNEGVQYEYPYIETDINDIALNFFRQPQIDEIALAAAAISVENFELKTHNEPIKDIRQ